jgi:hypothetical protein
MTPASSHTTQTKTGAVTKRANGKVSDVHDNAHNMDVHHNLNGAKHVSVKRADGSRVVAERGRPGYVERGYHYHGHDFARRSYYYHGVYYNNYYRGYYYGGVYMNVYAPAFYYGPGFYGWAYNPWYSPIAFGWGWGGFPWYGYYGFYFNPYPVYAGPAFWLTDYIVAAELQAAYTAQQEAHTEAVAEAAAAGAPLLSEAIKQQIADEVKAQIALENQEAQQTAAGQDPDPGASSVARMVQMADGKPHVFVAASALDVVDSSGTECAISDGDALEVTTPVAEGATDANLVVLSSKGGSECKKADTVTVAVSDLQEMQNSMRETLDRGLKELQAKQGTGGLPAAPASATAAPTATAFSQAAPPPEPAVDKDINTQLATADQVDSAAATASPIGGVDSNSTPAAPAAPVNIALGQSIEDVTTALGNPLTVIDLGPKKIYKYKDMKITFKAGKVTDVE